MAGGGGGGSGGLSANATSILCWTFLPQFLTNALVSTFYRLSPSSRPTIPPNANPQHLASAQARSQLHHRRARVLLVTAYLLYSVLSVYYAQSVGLEQNYYSLLGLPREALENDPSGVVKSHWRRLARRFHPDKVGKAGEPFFLRLRTGVEVLESDSKRWAYERFGPEANEWGAKLVTQREFLATGAARALVWWAFAFGSIFAFSFLRKSERQYNFWRYLSLFLCLALEFHLVMRTTESPTFSLLFPHRLPFEHVSILRQIFISTSMAMSQLAPVLFPPAPETAASASSAPNESDSLAAALRDADELKPLLTRLTQLTTTAEAEAIALQQLELRPLLASAPTPGGGRGGGAEAKIDAQEVRRRVRDHMVRTFEDLQLKQHPATAAAWSAAVRAGLEREGKRGGRAVAKTTERKAVGGPPVHDAFDGGETAQETDSSQSEEVAAGPSLAVIPPPVASLASPPPSPPHGASESVPEAIVPPEALAVPSEDPTTEAAAKPADDALQPPSERADFRLPTPPPDP